MSQTPLIYPAYFRVVRREENTWHFRKTELFYQSDHSPKIDFANLEAEYGLTMGQVAIALFGINGGRAGLYLANLRDRKYYYCGLDFADVKTMLLSLGIGRSDPLG